ncbi:hypothetical protein [Prosthecobacter sp.]|uniref:YncE family protein n=1 Tax=Prosthecobacter sp. TaxID=1965333 RepID=UPI001D3B33C3|nr:hypothetical protein [Prosthecobacter sp.]MCB1276798.1 hypothetical protein [Prosthecobacter sp.]
MIISETIALGKGSGTPHDADRARLEFTAPPAVREALSGVGRTEDVRFSPDNRKLAITGFAKNTCLIFDIEVDRSGPRPLVRLLDCLEIRSRRFRGPHGIEFIGENQLLVANRGGRISLFAIPERPAEGGVVDAEPLHEVTRIGFLRRLNSPGSLCVLSASDDQAEILVCNNYTHRISRHILPLRAGACQPYDEVFLNKGFRIPDGIAIDAGKSWLAISNHDTHSVLMFDLNAALTPATRAVGELKGVNYPHGVRFSPDGRRLFVADAGDRFVHVYEADHAGGWRGERAPSRSLFALSEETYLKGRTNPQEGGPKGVDLSAAGDVMVITCHEEPLAFFHVPELLG